MSSVGYVIFLTLLISRTSHAQAQLTRNAGASLDGEIEPIPGPGLMVVLAGEDGRNYQADIDARGGFQLSGLPIGSYGRHTCESDEHLGLVSTPAQSIFDLSIFVLAIAARIYIAVRP